VGRCTEFGVIIKAGCDHSMQAGESSCTCPGCGVVCRGQYAGCPEVWAGNGPTKTAVAPPKRLAKAGPSHSVIHRGKAGDKQARTESEAPVPHVPRDSWFEAVDIEPAPTDTVLSAPAPAPQPVWVPQTVPQPVWISEPAPVATDHPPAAPPAPMETRAAEIEAWAADVTRTFEAERVRLERMATDLAGRAGEIDARAMAHTRAFENDRAWLERLAAELPTRARQLDDRAEAHLRMLETDRASLEALGQQLMARAQEIDARAAAYFQAVDHDRTSLPEELRRSIGATLPALVAEAVRLDTARRAERQTPPPAEGPPLRVEADPIIVARQRSLEKQVDGLTRRTQEIDERVTTHLRAIDDDRAVLADVIHHQDRMAQAIADADIDGRYDLLVNDAIPDAVAGAVDAAMKAKAAALSTAVGRVEKVRADTKAMADSLRESSEGVLDALFRRDQDSASQLQALAEERAAMTEMLEGGREEIAKSVVNSLPALVEVAVRTAMERYATERRSGVQELSSRLRADSDVMRDALQRSFEKMMEALASREQELEERAAAQVRGLGQEKSALSDLWSKAALAVTQALPGMVAEAVTDSEQLDRAELEAVRQETQRLREEHEAAVARLRDDHEATVAELREAVAELRTALIDRDGVVERQAAAYERALEGLRAAMARQPAKRSPRAADPEPEPDPEPEAESPVAALVAEVIDETNGGRVKFGRSAVPRAQRVERRMLKLDDRDDASWPGLTRRSEALADLLATKDD
jgi:hypothetical protein